MAKIDLHIITIPSTNQAWLDECLASVQHSDVAVHVVGGIVGHIGIGRKIGFEQGDAPYVAWIDPDDWLEPNALDTVLANLGENGLCTAEYVRDYNDFCFIRGAKAGVTEISQKNPFACHHLTVLKRDLVTPLLSGLLRYPSMPEYWLMLEVTKIVSIPYLHKPLYNWRIHPDQWHHQGHFDELVA